MSSQTMTANVRTADPATARAPEVKSFSVHPWLAATGLLVLTLVVYIPSYKAGFIWDDDVIAANPLMREGWSGLRDIWFSIRYGDFVPLTATTFWIEWQIYGGLKEIQHATNVVLQALNVVLLWRVLLRLRIPGSWVIAAVFAVHPVCVASVTWLAERKNTLSMTFYLLSLLYFFKSESVVGAVRIKPFSSRDYRLSFVFFLLGLLSKSAVVIMPVVVLLCAWWRDGQIGGRHLRRVAPFFIFAFSAGVVTLVAHFYYGPKLGVLPGDSALVRILTAGRAVWFYFAQELAPVGLTMHYPRWKIDPTSLAAYLPGLAIVAVLAVFWRFRRSWGSTCLFGFGYFLLALGPTIGVVNMAFLMVAPVADHFQYMALPGLIALVVGAGVYFLQRSIPNRLVAPAVVFLLTVPALASLSWQHQRLMGNAEALWHDNLKKNPESWVSYNNLGGIHFERGQFEDAERYYAQAVRFRTNLSMVQVNLGRSHFALGKTDAAIARYNEAIRLDPTDFKAYNNLGVAFITAGKTNEAIACFQKAVQLVPSDATFFANLARLLVESGRNREAMDLYSQRVKFVPSDSAAHYQLGGLLFAQGRLDEALHHYQEAVRLAPQFVEARFGLAEILVRQVRTAEAMEHWREILKVQPDAVQVLANLAWALATDRNDKLRNGVEAVAFAERAYALAGTNNPPYVDLLAATYAEAGRFAEAVKTEEQAVLLANASGQKDLAGLYRSRLNLYQAGRPVRAQ